MVAYKVLLGRPFDTITESKVKNAKDDGQSLMLTDPNTGERCVTFLPYFTFTPPFLHYDYLISLLQGHMVVHASPL